MKKLLINRIFQVGAAVPDRFITVQCGVRPSSFGICVCPQLTWPAPPSTAVDILLYLDLATTTMFCVLFIIINLQRLENR
jgi:hypothetical protein